jgi:hypothetical protein
MVGVAQLAERCVVVADVAGSSPVTHPIFCEGNDCSTSPVGAKWGQPFPNTHKLTREQDTQIEWKSLSRR